MRYFKLLIFVSIAIAFGVSGTACAGPARDVLKGDFEDGQPAGGGSTDAEHWVEGDDAQRNDDFKKDNWSWEEIKVLGNIPEDAITAPVKVEGADGGGETAAIVFYDDIEVHTDCVTDYAKIGGKIGGGSPPNKGTHSVGSLFYTLEYMAASAEGSLHVNYKDLKAQCTFKPVSSIEHTESAAGEGLYDATVVTYYECTGLDEPGETRTIVICAGTGGTNGPGPPNTDADSSAAD